MLSSMRSCHRGSLRAADICPSIRCRGRCSSPASSTERRIGRPLIRMGPDIFLLSFVALVLEVLLYGRSCCGPPHVARLTWPGVGIYCVFFAGSIWVLAKRRRAAESRSVSMVIDVCSWFIFIALTIVRCTFFIPFVGSTHHLRSISSAPYTSDTRA
jgi:hypothetical protein